MGIENFEVLFTTALLFLSVEGQIKCIIARHVLFLLEASVILWQQTIQNHGGEYLAISGKWQHMDQDF